MYMWVKRNQKSGVCEVNMETATLRYKRHAHVMQLKRQLEDTLRTRAEDQCKHDDHVLSL